MAVTDIATPASSRARAAIAANPLWYHTFEVAPGVDTPGWFDLRPILDRLPWPEVRGLRCLDVGTYDGHLAFELERRGASEVVATDIVDHEQWDWPARMRARGPEALRAIAGEQKGLGFEIAHELLDSAVRREPISVYDLSPERVGEFDVVVCGSLLLHLRDPIRALEAMRLVCRGRLLCTNEVSFGLSLLLRHRPAMRFDGVSELLHWWLPNTRAHRQMVESAGFEVERESGLYAVPFGPAHPTRRLGARAVARRVFCGGDGVPHHAVLARPAV